MIVAKIGEDYARELTGAKFLVGAFFGRVCNMKTRNGSYFEKPFFRNLAPFAQTAPHYFAELSDLEPLDEPSEPFVVKPPTLAFNVLPLGSTTRVIRP
jgi:hypothetical protein